MKTILLIPSARLVCDELKFELGYIPPAMIPVRGKPVFEQIIARYNYHKNILKFIACNQGKDKIKNYVEKTKQDCSLIDIPIIKDLGSTIFHSLTQLKDRGILENSYLYVNFADTIAEYSQSEKNRDIVLYSTIDDPFRWTSFKIDSNNRIISITEKYTKVVDDPGNIFIGVFGFSKPLRFLICLSKHIDKNNKIDSFYRAFMDYAENIEYTLQLAEEWIDVGHLDTYYDAKKKFINYRSFNYISVDHNTNILIKRSNKKMKLIDEISWYVKLPKDLQHIVPRIYDYSLDSFNPFIEMEYIGYPCLSDIYLYGSHTRGTWNSMLNSLFSLIDEFRQFRYGVGKDDLKKTLHDMYCTKTVDRLSSLRDNKHFYLFFKKEKIRINGIYYKSLENILESLNEEMISNNVLDLPYLNIIHGDMCLPNILFDTRNRIIKLIDPRGKFGKYDLYGDYRYDLAKLRHSICGHYDFIVNDLFEIEVDNSRNSIRYSIYTEKRHKDISNLFDEKIKQRYDETGSAIRLIESLLFLSMVPLHSDNLKQQHCMLSIGIEKFNESI